jgi:class 3 adenylate cyclase/tetratricopeptide (TPR) repeat protein
MELLTTYLPSDRCHALARAAGLPDRCRGAVLFADVSGFTPLSELLARTYGPRRGAEELTLHLNAVYDALIHEVDALGGSVIAFAGDAITCWFDGDDGRCAAACGLAMQRAMPRFAVVRMADGREVTLAVKIAVAAGPARRFLAGDPAIRLLDVLAGRTLERVAAAAHVTERGEVVLDEPTAAPLADALEWGEARTGSEGARFRVVRGLRQALPPQEVPGPPVLSDRLTRPWLVPSVYARLKAGLGEFLTELRPAVAAFVKFDGIDYDDDPEAGEKLSTFVSWIQRLLEPLEGVLLDLNFGDKGSYLYYVFGAPMAHEDDTRRALTVARQMVHAPEVHPFLECVQVGLNRGTMRTGAYGGTSRRTYGVLGDDVNLAARLMEQAAPGQVLVTGKVQGDCPTEFGWEALPPLRAKGKSAPVAVFGLLEPRTAARHTVLAPEPGQPMVGRTAELARSEDRLARVLAGSGQVLGITGEAGMGKSRLVAELVQRAHAAGMALYGGAAESFGTNTSYLPWREVWQEFFQVDLQAPRARQLQVLERCLAAVGPGLPARAPLLGGVLNLDLPDNDLTRHFDAKLRKASLEDLLLECLRHRVRQGPVLLVLEDCQWLDPLSRDLLECIARAAASLPLFILLAYRPPESSAARPLDLAGQAHFTELTLAELPAHEAEALLHFWLRQIFGDNAKASVELQARLLARAQGNPFYLEELLRYLHDQGVDPGATLRPQELELPVSLHSLILSRIDRLLESQKATLKVASVLGRLFPAAALWGIGTHLSEPQVRADLHALTRAELTVEDQPEPELVYLFRHVVTQEVTYESLAFSTRAALHHAIGLYLESQGPEAVARNLDLLALHFDRSPDTAKRRHYLLRAGEAAQVRYANAAALDYYERALALLEPADQPPVRMKLARVLERVGCWTEAQAQYQTVLSLAAEHKQRPAQAAAYTALGELHRKRSAFADAVRCLELARALFVELRDEAGRAETLHYAGSVAAQQGHYDEACALYQRSLEIRRRLRDRPAIASLLSNLGIVAWCRGEFSDARAYYEAALHLRREIGDRWAIAVSLNNLGLVLRDLGDVAGARSMLEQALALSREIGDRWSVANTLSSLGDVALTQNELDAARGFLFESLGISRDLNDRQAQTFLLDFFSVLAAKRGRAPDAFRLVGAAQALRQTLGSPLSPSEQARLDATLDAVCPAASATDRAAWTAAGAGLDAEAAFGLALEASAPAAPASAGFKG